MSKQYRDFGSLSNGQDYSELVDNNKKTQVYNLTHEYDKEVGAWKSRSYLNKSFISFTYGGKKIEDFGLVAVTIDNKLDRENPPQHEDYTTDARMLDGQYYWGSHYNARQMVINLATDSITQEQLDNFKYWFQAGEIRELILAQHPNRGILARVAEQPRIEILPFKQKIRRIINQQEKEVIIAEYKGNIELKFVMDEPFWYAINNALCKVAEGENDTEQLLLSQDRRVSLVNKWITPGGEEITNELTDDMIKVALEDNIPTREMINPNVNLADNLGISQIDYLKYTLTNQPTPVSNVVGTPLVNNIFDTVPIAGAITGPVYNKIYSDEQVIEGISPVQSIEGSYIYITGESAGAWQYQPLTDEYRIGIKDYLPVKGTGKEECYITLNTTIPSVLTICFYDKNDKKFIRSQQLIRTVDNPNETLKCVIQEDYYIRFFITMDIDAHQQPDTINSYLDMHLVTFSEEDYGYALNNTRVLNYFYSGTAQSYPIIKFGIKIEFNQDGYISVFKDDYNNNDCNYNTLCLESNFKHQMHIINPSIFTSYNKVIAKLKAQQEELDVTQAIKWFREQIGHPGVRNWIINCINIYKNTVDSQLTGANKFVKLKNEDKMVLLKFMPYLFVSIDETNIDVKQQYDLPKLVTDVKEITHQYTQETLDKIDNQNRLAINTQDHQDLVITVDTSKHYGDDYYYQWQYSNDPQTEWRLVTDGNGWSGSESPELVYNDIPDSEVNSNTWYKCVISNNYNIEETIPIQVCSVDYSLVIVESLGVIVDNPSSLSSGYACEASDITLQWETQGYLDQSRTRLEYQLISDNEANNNNPWKEISVNNKGYFSDFNISYQNSMVNNTMHSIISIHLGKISNDAGNGYNFRLTIGNIKFNVMAYQDQIITISPIIHFVKPELILSVKGNGQNDSFQEIDLNSVVYVNNYFRIAFSSKEHLSGFKYQVNKGSGWTSVGSGSAAYYQSQALTGENDNSNYKYRLYCKYKYNTSLTSYTPSSSGIKLNIRQQYAELQAPNYTLTGTANNYIGDSVIINTGQQNSIEETQYEWKFRPKNSSTWTTLTMNDNNNNGPIIIYDQANHCLHLKQLQSNNAGQYRVNISKDRAEAGSQKDYYGDYQGNTDYTEDQINNYITINVAHQAELSSKNITQSPFQYAYNVGEEDTLKPNITLSCNVNYASSYQWFATYKDKTKADKAITDLLDCENGQNITISVSLARYTISQLQQFEYFYCTIKDEYDTYVQNEHRTNLFSLKFNCNEYQTINTSNGLTNIENVNWNWKWPYVGYSKSADTASANVQGDLTSLVKIFTVNKACEFNNTNGTFTGIPHTAAFNAVVDNYANYDITYSGSETSRLKAARKNALIAQYTSQGSSDSFKTFQTIKTISINPQVTGTQQQYRYTTIKIKPIINIANNRNIAIRCRAIYKNEQNENIEHNNEVLISQLSNNTEIEIYSDQDSLYEEVKFIDIQVFPVYLNAWPSNLVIKYNSMSQALEDVQAGIGPTLENYDISGTSISFEISGIQTTLPSQNSLNLLMGTNYTNDDQDIVNITPRNLKLAINKKGNVLGNTYTPVMSLNSNMQTEDLFMTSIIPVSINCKTGEYFATFKYNKIKWPDGILESQQNANQICYLSNLRFNEPQCQSTESIGDMIIYNQLVFNQQNHINYNTGKIQQWNQDDKTLCHKLTYDGLIPLLNFHLQYKNLYL